MLDFNIININCENSPQLIFLKLRVNVHAIKDFETLFVVIIFV